MAYHSTTTPVAPSKISALHIMTAVANKTSSVKRSNGIRYTGLEKDFYTYRYIQGGPALYDFERANSPAPHIRTLQRFLKKHAEDVQEGKIMVKDLKAYLLANGYPLVVCWSEDATRITGGIEYKPSTDQITGLVAPLDETTGLPNCNMECSSPQAVLDLLRKHSIGRNVQLAMVQPMLQGASPFCVNYYCTDNRFSTEDVTKKWEHADFVFRQEGIEIACKSTDGDSRFIRSMINKMQLPTVTPNRFGEWFVAIDCLDAIFVQDPTHLANKFRTRLMNPAKDLVIGRYRVSKVHLEELIKIVSKDQHGLVISDLSSQDKMKFKPVEKITQPNVIDQLKSNIPLSDGTAEYLKVCSYGMAAYMNEDLSPTERIYQIWLTSHPSSSMCYINFTTVGIIT